MNFRVSVTRVAMCGLAALGMTAAVSAAECPEGFPSKPVEIWNGYSPGGLSDTLSRSLASIMERQQDWTVTVFNKPGAGTSVMWAELSRAPADGYAMGVSAGPSAVTRVPFSNPDSPYQPDSFTWIGTAQQLTTGFSALTDAPFSNWEEMIAYAKEKGRLTASTAGADQEYITDAISEQEGINMVLVPATGAADAVAQTLGGHTDLAVAGTTDIEHLRAGTMRRIFSLGSVRAPFADYAPSTTELGYDLAGSDFYVYFGAPAGLSPELTTCLAGALDEAVNSEEFAKLTANYDAEPLNLGPEGLTRFIMEDAAKFKALYEKSGN